MIERPMQLIGNPHVLSNLIVALTCIYIFFRYVGLRPARNRWLFGIFLIAVSLRTIADFLDFILTGQLAVLVKVLSAGEMTLGMVCLVAASWCLVRRTQASGMFFGCTLFLGGTLFYCVTWFHVEYVAAIVSAFCIVVILLICCLGLGGRQKGAFWLILSMMLVALATKSKTIPLPLHPEDISHYMTAAAIVCLGWAIRDERRILF